jgi:hypothetical protein
LELPVAADVTDLWDPVDPTEVVLAKGLPSLGLSCATMHPAQTHMSSTGYVSA